MTFLEFENQSFLALLIVTATIALIGISHFKSSRGLCLDINCPLPFYGIFYVIYYLFPFLLLLFAGQFPEGHEIAIACLLLGGYLAFSLGVSNSRVKHDS